MRLSHCFVFHWTLTKGRQGRFLIGSWPGPRRYCAASSCASSSRQMDLSRFPPPRCTSPWRMCAPLRLSLTAGARANWPKELTVNRPRRGQREGPSRKKSRTWGGSEEPREEPHKSAVFRQKRRGQPSRWSRCCVCVCVWTGSSLIDSVIVQTQEFTFNVWLSNGTLENKREAHTKNHMWGV